MLDFRMHCHIFISTHSNYMLHLSPVEELGRCLLLVEGADGGQTLQGGGYVGVQRTACYNYMYG